MTARGKKFIVFFAAPNSLSTRRHLSLSFTFLSIKFFLLMTIFFKYLHPFLSLNEQEGFSSSLTYISTICNFDFITFMRLYVNARVEYEKRAAVCVHTNITHEGAHSIRNSFFFFFYQKKNLISESGK